MNKSVDLACEQLLTELSIKVMLESDVGSQRRPYSPLTEEELATYNILVDSPNKIHSSSLLMAPTVEILTGEASPGTGTFFGAVDKAMGGSTQPSPPLPTLADPLADMDSASALVLPAGGIALSETSPMVGGSTSPLAPHHTAHDLMEEVFITSSTGSSEGCIVPHDPPVAQEGHSASPRAVAMYMAEGEPYPAARNAELPNAQPEGEGTGPTPKSQAASGAAQPANGTTSPLDIGATSPLNAGLFKPALAVPPIKELRRSARIAALADIHTLHKAEGLTAKKNLEYPGNSFTTFPASKIISNLGRVGINLGSSDVVVIKNLEVDRLVLCANQKKSCPKPRCSSIDSDVEREDRLEAVLSHACGNLNENMLDTENDQIIDLSPLRRKKKYNNAKNTNKGRLPKKPKTPSKIILR